VTRRLAAEDPAVNEEWNCDKGRWAFAYATLPDRIRTPLVRAESGELVEASWTEALERAAVGLREARDAGGVGVLPGGRLTLEDAYTYAKFARVVLGTNDVDARARAHSAEELDFLASRVAGVGTGVSYAALEAAPVVLLVGLEPEEESPIIFLRLRKAARRRGQKLFAVGPVLSDGVRKAFGTLLPTPPGGAPALLRRLSGATSADTEQQRAGAEALRTGGAVVLAGERLAEIPGALTGVAALARSTGARLAWVPRRAGERGAVDAGALPTLLPGARRVGEDRARAEVERVWDVALPTTPGRDTTAILAAAAAGALSALLVGGVDPADLPDPALATRALDSVGFLISLELRRSAVTERADVVLPVAPAVEKSGTYVDWEGRRRPFGTTLTGTGALSDGRVLHSLADELDVDLGLPTPAAALAELDRLDVTGLARGADPAVPAAGPPAVPSGRAVLASWRLLLDNGSLQDGEPYLAGTAKPPVAMLSASTAAEIGAVDGQLLTVRAERGAITLPLRVADMPDRVVWLPARSPGCELRGTLGVGAGAVVEISFGGAP
jgi:NADH-quinone oxidoreductase subunit G